MSSRLPAADDSGTRARRPDTEWKYREAFDAIDLGFCVIEVIFDAQGHACDYRFIEVNRAFAATTGLINPIGRRMREIEPHLEEFWFRAYGRVATTGIPERFEGCAESLGHWYNVYAFRIGEPHKRHVAILFENITDRKATEQASAQLAALTAHSAEAIIGIGPDGTIESWNSSAERLFGYCAEEARGRHISMIAPEDRRSDQENTGRRLLAGESVRLETVCRCKDGRDLQVLLTAGPIRDNTGTIIGVSASLIDISERKAMEQALHEANRRKDEFLATLAHELRNPLAPIRNGLQIARLTAKADSTLHRAVDMMDRQLTHLVRMVDDLMDVSRINSGKIKLKKKRVLLQDIVAASAESCEVAIEAHRHELVVESLAPTLYVQGDPARLTQVFCNLLSNSTKYTEPGGRIRVRLERDGDHAVVHVSDTGIGIPTDEIGHVFDLFSQVHVHQAQADGGLGIGLSLVRSLVQMHGGTVRAQSAGPGLGSTFTVRLPLSEDAIAASEPGGAKPAAANPLRILVADDNIDAATSLAFLLELEGHTVRTAIDGYEAVEQTEEFGPEVVILDLGMPHMDGLEAARRIRRTPRGERMVLIALTGWGQDADRERTQAAGFDVHLVKPVDPGELSNVITQRAAAR